MTGKQRVEAMLKTGTSDCLPFMPLTMMFAAARIEAPYREYAADHRVLVEGQLRTAEEFDFDHVSCVSDPAREAADCGALIEYFADQPPAINESAALLTDKTTLARLPIPDPLGGGRMHDRVQAAALFKENAGNERLIEGWIEGPCAEAADLRGINALMLDFYEDPVFVRDLFEFTLQLGLRFGRAQVEAGVDIVGVGDAAASLVGPALYEEFVWPFEKRLVDGLHEMGTRVRLHICGNTRPLLGLIGRLGCDIVDLDYMAPLDEARAAMGPDQVLLGNLDPVATLRNGTPDTVRAAAEEAYRQAGAHHIVGAGCEVVRDTPLENLRAYRDFARSVRP